MDWLEERIGDLLRERYNCAQIMMILSLELRGRENPELVQCMYGLNSGLHSMHVCGTLTGGCCLLASYGDAQRRKDVSRAFLPAKEIVKAYVHWFEKQFGSLICMDLIGGDRYKIREFCPGLIKDNFEKCMEILDESGIDPHE